MKQIDLLAYRNVNEAFRRRLVYHIGKDCGFFVELNFMLDAMLWSLNHRIQFQLYSEDANFGTGTGWAEYFQPFCPEVHEPFHHRYNFHMTPTWKHIIQCSIRQKKPQLIPWKLKSVARACIARLLAFMTYHERVFLSQDVDIAPLTHYVVPKLGIDADYLEAYGMLARMIWRLQPEMLSHKAEVIKTHILPNLYSGIQIRGGDKIIESTLIGGLPIMGRLQPSAGEHVFVLTDDYRLFDEISQHYPRVYLHTLCQPTERGYYHQQFCQTSPADKRASVIKLLVSVDILLHSRSFVGTITAGPSVFILKTRIDDPQAFAVDCPKAELPQYLRLTIDRRARISRQNMKNDRNSHKK